MEYGVLTAVEELSADGNMTLIIFGSLSRGNIQNDMTIQLSTSESHLNHCT
jgi:hypothetical protein